VCASKSVPSNVHVQFFGRKCAVNGRSHVWGIFHRSRLAGRVGNASLHVPPPKRVVEEQAGVRVPGGKVPRAGRPVRRSPHQ